MMYVQAGMFPESGVRASNMIQKTKDNNNNSNKELGLSEGSLSELHKCERKNNGKITF